MWLGEEGGRCVGGGWEVCWRRVGGVLEGGRCVGGGWEVCWRRVGGVLGEWLREGGRCVGGGWEVWMISCYNLCPDECFHLSRHHLVARAESFLGDFRAALQHEKAAHTIYSSKVRRRLAACVGDGTLRVCCTQLGPDHEKTKESSECLKQLTERAVTVQKTVRLN